MANPTERDLRPLLSDEFLAVLVQAARTCGYTVDYVEVEAFFRWCFSLADKEAPDLEPFPDSEE